MENISEENQEETSLRMRNEALAKRWSMRFGTKVTPTQVHLCEIDFILEKERNKDRDR